MSSFGGENVEPVNIGCNRVVARMRQCGVSNLNARLTVTTCDLERFKQRLVGSCGGEKCNRRSTLMGSFGAKNVEPVNIECQHCMSLVCSAIAFMQFGRTKCKIDRHHL